MNDRQLNFFIVVAEEKNLGRAAERLPLSLSALSRQIQSLEEELGAILFIRTVSGLELTPAGQALLSHAKELKLEFELIRNDVLRASQVSLGKLNIGYTGSTILNYIPIILKEYSARYPGANIELHAGHTSQQLEYLHQGKTQIFFDRNNFASPELAADLAFKDSIMVAIPENHPLACLPAITFEDLRNEPMIGRQNEKNNPPEYFALQEQHGFKLKIVQKVQDMIAATAMVGCGIGLALVASSLQQMRIPNVIFRPLISEKNLPCDLYAIYRKNEQTSELKAILSIVHSYLSANQ